MKFIFKIINKLLRYFNLILLNISRYHNDINLKFDLKLEEIYLEIEKFFSNDRVVFDVGAHIGGTRDLYNNIFKKAKIHSFEPNQKLYKKLKESSVYLNKKNQNQIFSHNIAFGNKSEVKKYYEYEYGYLSGFYKIQNEVAKNVGKHANLLSTQEIITNTGDSFCETNKIENIDFLKINVQGYEPEIIKGFKMMLKHNKIKFILSEFDYSGRYEKKVTISDLENILTEYNYELFDFLLLRKGKSHKIKLNYGYVVFANKEINNSKNWL